MGGASDSPRNTASATKSAPAAHTGTESLSTDTPEALATVSSWWAEKLPSARKVPMIAAAGRASKANCGMRSAA